MTRRTRLVTGITCAILAVLVLLWLLFAHASAPARTAITWKMQPDRFPLGSVLQGSRVEMSLGLLSGVKPKPMPAFVTALSPPLRKGAEWGVEKFRDAAVKMGLRVRVDAPAFVEVERTQVTIHPSQGPFVVVSFRLKTDSPGDCRGNLIVHLQGRAYGATNIIVPLSAKVVGAAALSSRAVLIAETPYERYATDNGDDFEPLAALNVRLSGQGVRVDFCRRLPRSLALYRAILVAGDQMAELNPAQTEQVRKFVAGGGRLILAANAFYVPTVRKANTVLSSYGLQIIDRDAGQAVTNSRVVSDLLTRGVRAVDFHRPSQIDVTDLSQGKLLVESEDGQGGYVAISRQTPRGEVIVLTQSLWWTWIRSDPAKADNRLLLENLLAH